MLISTWWLVFILVRIRLKVNVDLVVTVHSSKTTFEVNLDLLVTVHSSKTTFKS